MARMKKKKPKVAIGLEMPEMASGLVSKMNEYLMSKMSEIMGVPKSLAEPERKIEEFTFAGKKFYYDKIMVDVADDLMKRAEEEMWKDRSRHKIYDEKLLSEMEKFSKEYVSSTQDDIEPEWEMDLASGAIRNHDMVVDQNGESFIIMDGKPCSTTSGVVVKPKGELRVVSSSFKEADRKLPDDSSTVHRFATGGFVSSGKGLLAAIEESGSKSTYEPLTKEKLESAIKDLMSVSERDFKVFTGARGYGKSASAAKELDRVIREEYKKWVPDPVDTLCIFHEGRVYSIRNADGYLLEKKKASLMDDEESYEMAPEERMKMYDLISKELAVRASYEGSGYNSMIGVDPIWKDTLEDMRFKGGKLEGLFMHPGKEEFIAKYPYMFDEAKSTPEIPTHGDGPRAKSVGSKPVSSFHKWLKGFKG